MTILEIAFHCTFLILNRIMKNAERSTLAELNHKFSEGTITAEIFKKQNKITHYTMCITMPALMILEELGKCVIK